jgi:hypothetical protein
MIRMNCNKCNVLIPIGPAELFNPAGHYRGGDDAHKYLLCNSCNDKLQEILHIEYENIIESFIQPERLNPETSKEDAIV